ncbi:uncharacterized protein LOC132175490 [Corylus avellana]|uniref:uncharacterized protein LOC132175490 n=1 Tax=Corylus avellana TaxID=13451 RepID=UPI00286AE347|nr:uncharacterized protein LOC132175490 [Corylus avellana]
MPLSITAITSKVLIAFPSLPTSKIVKPCTFPLKNDGNIAHPRANAFMASRSLKFVANSVFGDGSVLVAFNVPFPSDYSELLDQARNAIELALKDNRQLMVS